MRSIAVLALLLALPGAYAKKPKREPRWATAVLAGGMGEIGLVSEEWYVQDTVYMKLGNHTPYRIAFGSIHFLEYDTLPSSDVNDSLRATVADVPPQSTFKMDMFVRKSGCVVVVDSFEFTLEDNAGAFHPFKQKFELADADPVWYGSLFPCGAAKRRYQKSRSAER